MATEVASAYVKISADVDKLKSDLASMRGEVKKNLDGIHKDTSRGAAAGIFMALSMGAGMVGDAIGGMISTVREWINVAAEGEEVSARFDVAVKKMGDRVGFTAAEMKTLVAQTQALGTGNRSQTQEAAFALLESGNIRGNNFTSALSLMQDLAGTMKGDAVAAAHQLARELENPTRALAMMHREGMLIPDDVKRSVEQMMKLGDVAGAQAQVITLLQQKYSGYGEAFNNTFLGQWQKFSGILDQIKTDLLQSFLPAFKPIVKLAEDLLHLIERNQPAIDAWGKKFTGWMEQAGAWLQNKLIDAWVFFETAISSDKGWNAAMAQLKVWAKEAENTLSHLALKLLYAIDQVTPIIGSKINKAIWGDWHKDSPLDKKDIGTEFSKAWNAEISLPGEFKGVKELKELKDGAKDALDDYAKEAAERKQKILDDLNKAKNPPPPGEGMKPTPSKDYGEGGRGGKIEFVGFQEFWKQMQQSFSNSSMVGLTQQIVKNTGESKDATQAMAQDIRALLNKKNGAIVAPDAVAA